VQFPWPEKATDVQVAGVPAVWSYLADGISGAKVEKSVECTMVEKSTGCTFLRLDVPVSSAHIGAYGEIKLAYALPAAAPPAPPPSARTLVAESEGGRPDKIRKMLSSRGDSLEEIRRNLPKDLAALEKEKAARMPPPPPPAPKRRVVVDTVIVAHEWRQSAGMREGSLKPDHDSPSPAREGEHATLNEARKASLRQGR
jgi:hypothetical protein